MNPLYQVIAACPACRGATAELVWSADSVVCSACGRRYPAAAGVPVMLLDKAGEPAAPAAASPAAATRSWRRRLSQAMAVPSFSYKTAESRERIPRFLATLGPQAIALNLGSGSTHFGPRVVNLDIAPFANVDVVAGGERLPVRTACLDAVITQGVLEHVPHLAATLAEIDRVLRPGGLVYHEAPFIQGYHGSPGDYRRFTAQGVSELAPGYTIVAQGVAVGPSSAVGWLVSEWLALLFSFGSQRLHRLGRRLFGWLLSPLKLADAWLEHHPQAQLTACAFYVVARKPPLGSELG